MYRYGLPGEAQKIRYHSFRAIRGVPLGGLGELVGGLMGIEGELQNTGSVSMSPNRLTTQPSGVRWYSALSRSYATTLSSLFRLLGRNLRRRVDRLSLQGKNAAAVAVSRRLKAVAEAAINLNANYVRLALLVIRAYDPMRYDFVNEAEILRVLGR